VTVPTDWAQTCQSASQALKHFRSTCIPLPRSQRQERRAGGAFGPGARFLIPKFTYVKPWNLTQTSGSGKSVALAMLADWARASGWLTVYVPSASVFMNNGYYHKCAFHFNQIQQLTVSQSVM